MTLVDWNTPLAGVPQVLAYGEAQLAFGRDQRERRALSEVCARLPRAQALQVRTAYLTRKLYRCVPLTSRASSTGAYRLPDIDLLLYNTSQPLYSDCLRRVSFLISVLVFCRDAKELSRRDKQAVRGFCVYLSKESDELGYQLNKQRDHDTHRYHKVRMRARRVNRDARASRAIDVRTCCNLAENMRAHLVSFKTDAQILLPSWDNITSHPPDPSVRGLSEQCCLTSKVCIQDSVDQRLIDSCVFVLQEKKEREKQRRREEEDAVRRAKSPRATSPNGLPRSPGE